jgi:methylaspartate mutase sigma subunit
MKDILLYLGGQLVIGEHQWSEVEKMFKDMGFNRVYNPDIGIPQILQDLETDLSRK